jgi:hypothetical protein
MRSENKPYVWRSSSHYPRRAYLEYNRREGGADQYIFLQASSVKETNYDLILRCKAKDDVFTKFDVLENSTVAPIVNKKVVDLLNNVCPTDFQYFPVTIINFPDTEEYINKDYYLLNITKHVDSVDRSISYIETREGDVDIKSINKLYFKPDCMGSVHLARERYFHPLKLVSPFLVKEFKNHKIKSVNFLTDIESYHRPFPEEYLTHTFPEDPEAAKRSFVCLLNNTADYEFFKTRIHNMSPEVLDALIEMTLSRSSFHKEQCEEIREIMRKRW